MSNSDIVILDWIQNHFIPYSIPVLQFISNTTTFTSITLTIIVLAISVALRSKTIRIKFFTLSAVLILVAGISQGIKALIFIARPFITYQFIEKLSEGGGSSFPSGHTMEAFALATALTLLFPNKKVVIPAYIWATLVAYSRLALGVHYPTDVVAGMLIGAFIGWVVPWLLNRVVQS